MTVAVDGTDPDFDRTTAFMDDIYWARQVYAKPFTWQRYLNWWVARRWLIPRDVRRR